METYVILAKFSQPGKMTPDSAGEMMKATQEKAIALGITLSSWLMTHGRFDSILTFQAPDAFAATKFAMSLAAGGLRTETLRAFTAEEAMSLLA